ncbi:MAG TPA: hypothetical protein VNU44_06630 [Bryobacteraceae bacterium]|nr:hypothetical protein [Bryobacteraceae bacterium]
MRCLHCNKKLSLLKLAKGDSFCSAEHFDAYQLQLSRSAYDRLVSVPEEGAPKPPLILKKSPEEAEPTRDLEADSALARLSALRAPEKKEAVPEPQVPPYAPFLVSPPPYNPPIPVVPASEPDGNEPVAAARDLAFPVHQVQETVGVLNWYLRVGVAEAPPRDWAREPEITIVNPENFSGEITRPALAAGPNVEEFVEVPPVAEGLAAEPAVPVENQSEPLEMALGEVDEPVAPAEAGPIEPVLAVDAQSTLELELAVEFERLAAGTNAGPFENPAPSEMEAPVAPAAEVEAVDHQPSLEMELAEEFERLAAETNTRPLENPALSEVDEPVAPAAEVHPIEAAAASLEPILPNAEPFENPTAGEVEPVSSEPFENRTSSEMDEPLAIEAAASTNSGEKRLPFLVAPSFRGRDWAEAPFDAAASSAARDWMLAPALDMARQRAEVWTSAIAPSTGFAGIPPLQPRDAAIHPIQSGFAMTAVAAPLLPEEREVDFYGWQASSGPLGIGRAPLEISRVPAGVVDFALPAPAPVHPIAALPAGHRGLIPEAGSVVRSVLDTGPKGQEPMPVMFPLGATQCGFMATLAPFPAWEGSSPALRNQAPHFSTRPALADSAGPREFAAEPLRYQPDCGKHIQQDAGERALLVAMLPYRSTVWRRIDFAMPRGADPAPTGWQPAVCLLTPAGVWDRPELARNTASRGVFERRFTAAANSVVGHLESTVLAPTALPTAVDMPVRDWRIGLCAPTIAWNPCLPAIPNRPLAFLPARGSAILPSASAWPRLGALA